MTAANLPLTIEQGATFRLAFQWTQDDGTTPVADITGWSVRMQIRRTAGQPVLVEATTGTGEFTIVSGPEARVALRLSPDQTNSIPALGAKYDIELVATTPVGDEDVYRILQGDITMSPNITQVAGSEVLET